MNGRIERDRGRQRDREKNWKRNSMVLMDRPREREVYLDEKQNSISFPCVSLYVCVCVWWRLYRDSLMAVWIVNSRSRCLPPLTSTTAVQSVGSTLTKNRTHILAQSLTLITAGWHCSVSHTLFFLPCAYKPSKSVLTFLFYYYKQT